MCPHPANPLSLATRLSVGGAVGMSMPESFSSFGALQDSSIAQDAPDDHRALASAESGRTRGRGRVD